MVESSVKGSLACLQPAQVIVVVRFCSCTCHRDDCDDNKMFIYFSPNAT